MMSIPKSKGELLHLYVKYNTRQENAEENITIKRIDDLAKDRRNIFYVTWDLKPKPGGSLRRALRKMEELALNLYRSPWKRELYSIKDHGPLVMNYLQPALEEYDKLLKILGFEKNGKIFVLDIKKEVQKDKSSIKKESEYLKFMFRDKVSKIAFDLYVLQLLLPVEADPQTFRTIPSESADKEKQIGTASNYDDSKNFDEDLYGKSNDNKVQTNLVSDNKKDWNNMYQNIMYDDGNIQKILQINKTINKTSESMDSRMHNEQTNPIGHKKEKEQVKERKIEQEKGKKPEEVLNERAELEEHNKEKKKQVDEKNSVDTISNQQDKNNVKTSIMTIKLVKYNNEPEKKDGNKLSKECNALDNFGSKISQPKSFQENILVEKNTSITSKKKVNKPQSGNDNLNSETASIGMKTTGFRRKRNVDRSDEKFAGSLNENTTHESALATNKHSTNTENSDSRTRHSQPVRKTGITTAKEPTDNKPYITSTNNYGVYVGGAHTNKCEKCSKTEGNHFHCKKCNQLHKYCDKCLKDKKILKKCEKGGNHELTDFRSEETAV